MAGWSSLTIMALFRVALLLLLFVACACGEDAADSAQPPVLRVEFSPTQPEPSATVQLIVPVAAAAEAPKQPMRMRADVANDLPQAMAIKFQATPPSTPTSTTAVRTNSPVATQQSVAGRLAFHRAEFDRLTQERTQLTRQLIEAQVLRGSIEQQIKQQMRAFEESHAELVVQDALPTPRTTTRSLTCMGWKKTIQCRWNGRRNAALDKSCFVGVAGGAAGYCEVKDTETNEFFRVMRTNCSTMPTTFNLWCQVAPQFANFVPEIRRAVAATPTSTRPGEQEPPTQGIVLVARPQQLKQLEALVQGLRSLGCTLPIEIWYFADEMALAPPQMARLRGILSAANGVIRLRPFMRYVLSSQATPFARIHAVTYSGFTHVLYLDAGMVPLRDPSYLFTLPEFLESTALFWPHLFHPATTETNIQPASLLWEMLDLPFVDTFEQDDQVVLVKRDAAAAALHVLEVFASHRPNLFDKLSLLPMAKDFFRFAWLVTSTPFHMVRVPPSIAGSSTPVSDGRFCGTHAVQYDSSGSMVFLHPIDNALRVPGMDQLQAFDWRSEETDRDIRRAYRVESYKLKDAATSTTRPQLGPASTPFFISTETPTSSSKCFVMVDVDAGQSRVRVHQWQSLPQSVIAQRIQSYSLSEPTPVER